MLEVSGTEDSVTDEAIAEDADVKGSVTED